MAPAVRAALRQETRSEVVRKGALRTSRLAGRGEEEQVRRADPRSRGCLSALGTLQFCAGAGSAPADAGTAGPGVGWLFPPVLLLWLETVCQSGCRRPRVGTELLVSEESFALLQWHVSS